MEFQWRRSRRCEAGHCVEVGRDGERVSMRDSTAPDRAVLVFSRESWAAFLAGVKEGEFDSAA